MTVHQYRCSKCDTVFERDTAQGGDTKNPCCPGCGDADVDVLPDFIDAASQPLDWACLPRGG